MNPLHLFYITNIRIMQDITNGRCGWCGTDELYVKYHDQEWGKLVTDDKTLFEFLVLESAQAGLSWITILRKREGYRKAFYNFDAELVAQMTDEDIERLMQFEGIVKNRLKIKSTITNAKLFLAVQKEFGSFYNYTLSFFPDKKPIINTFRSLSEIPVSIIRKTKRRGFPKRKVSKIRKFQKRNVFYLFKHTKGRENQNNPFPCLLFYTFNSNRTSSLPPIRLIVLSMLFS